MLHGQNAGFIFVPFNVQSTQFGSEALNVNISRARLNGIGLVLAAIIGRYSGSVFGYTALDHFVFQITGRTSA